MSKLSEMIKKLCPNGVEYKRLGEVAHYSITRIDASNITSRNYVGVENLKPDKEFSVILIRMIMMVNI